MKLMEAIIVMLLLVAISLGLNMAISHSQEKCKDQYDKRSCYNI